MSEAQQAKAGRYLLEGRVKAIVVTDGTALFHVSGSSPGDPYYVKHDAAGWHCDCPARVNPCAHILACRTVTRFEPDTHPRMVKDPDVDAILGKTK